MALNVGCEIAGKVNPGVGKACSAAEFATNVALVGAISAKTAKLARKSGALAHTRSLALMASVVQKKNFLATDSHDSTFSASIADLEQMLSASPHVYIASERTVQGNDTLIVPQLVDDSGNGMTKINLRNFEPAGNTASSIPPMEVKDVSYDAVGNRIVRYGELKSFHATSYLSEIVFRIDDLHPDSIRSFSVDFNNRGQIIFDRGDGAWKVYFEIAYSRMEPLDVLSASPVSPDGRFILNIKSVLDLYEQKTGNTIPPSAILGDGTNVLYVSVVNKLGKSCSARFSYLFQATKLKGDPGWPLKYTEVSRFGNAYATLYNVAYDYITVDSAGLRVTQLSTGKKDSVAAKVSVDHASSDGSGWRADVNTDSIWNNIDTLSSGDYLFEWDFAIKVTTQSGTSVSHHVVPSRARLDATRPGLKLQVPDHVVGGTLADANWANVRDTLRDGALRAIRAYVVNLSLGTVDTLFYKAHVNAEFQDIRWKQAHVPMAEGRYAVVVQAYDYGDPDVATMDSLQHVGLDSGRTSWSKVIDASTGKFVQGINGVTLNDTIWVDRTPPAIVSGSTSVRSVPDSLRTGCLDSSKVSSLGYLVYNSCNRLSLSFNVRDVLANRSDAQVRVNLLFKDSVTKHERTFDDVLEWNGNTGHYNFIEPATGRIRDGVYSLTAEIRDMAGNVTKEKLVDKVVFDRRAPSVNLRAGAFFPTDSSVTDAVADISQAADDSRNVSAVSCYRMLETPDSTFAWTFVRKDSASATADLFSFAIPVIDWAHGRADGQWFLHARCYDDAGNPGYGMDYFGVGARYPRITYPGDTVNSFYYGTVLVKGEAPNPSVQEHSDLGVSFDVEWKLDTATTWRTDGIERLAVGAHSQVRDLALWHIPDSVSGMCVLRLSVRACDTCAPVTDEKEVPVYGWFNPLLDTAAVKVLVKAPLGQSVGVWDTIGITLDKPGDTALWKLDARLYVRSQSDTSLVEAMTYSVPRMSVPPFSGEPSALSYGLHVWQKGGAWTLRWSGTAKGAIADTAVLDSLRRDSTYTVPANVKRMVPRLVLKYREGTSVVGGVPPRARRDTVSAPAVSLDSLGLVIPAYDSVLEWNLDSLDGDTLRITFNSDSAFIVDLSTVQGADSVIYCGAASRFAYDAVAGASGVGTLYVHPDEYGVRLPWRGVARTGQVPGSDTVFAKFIVYALSDPSRVVTIDTSWLLVRASVAMVAVDTLASAPADIYSPNTSGQKSVFRYGIAGLGSRVRTEVLYANDSVAKTLDTNLFVKAGLSDATSMASWDGKLADSNMAPLGVYRFRVCILDSAGNTLSSMESKPFHILDGSGVIAVGTGGVGGTAAELLIDEVFEDLGEARFVGSIDYLMKVRAQGKFLPEQYRTFNYRWKVPTGAMQAPALWRKTRFSLGIQRQRDRFPVTIAVLLATEGYDLDAGFFRCKPPDHHYPYKIMVAKRTFDRYSPTVLDVSLTSFYGIVGYDKNDDDEYPYSIVMAVKVLPEGVFEDVKKIFRDASDGYGRIGTYSMKPYRGHDDSTFAVIWEAEDEWQDTSKFKNLGDLWRDYCSGMPCSAKELSDFYPDTTNLGLWFNNFNNKSVLWESGKYVYSDTVPPVPMIGVEVRNGTADQRTCAQDLSDTASADRAICGPATPEKAFDPVELARSKPHADMLEISVDHGYGSYFTDRSYRISGFCKEHSGAGGEVMMKLTFNVKLGYWEPPWGYTNLANAFVRFDPTNSTLYGNKGYFFANARNNAAGSLGSEFANFFGPSGWTFSYSEDDAMITAFEAQRFTMVGSIANPLWFPDEKDDSVKITYPSTFRWHYFGSSAGTPFGAVAEGVRSDGSRFRAQLTSNMPHSQQQSIGGGIPIDPLDICFTIAPVLAPNQAMVQDTTMFAVPYPYPYPGIHGAGFLKIPDSLASDFKFYQSERARIHFAVGDWNDAHWDSLYVVDGLNLIRNPFTDASLRPDTVVYQDSYVVGGSVGILDTFYSYSIDTSDYVPGGCPRYVGSAPGCWMVPHDSLHIPRIDPLEYGGSHGNPITTLVLLETDSAGNVSHSPEWLFERDSSGNRWNVGVEGFGVTDTLGYVYSRGSVKYSGTDRSHVVPLDSVLSQNKDVRRHHTEDIPWYRDMSYSVAGMYLRDTSISEDSLSPHPYLSAIIDSSSKDFYVTWNKLSPDSRMAEIATFRGRVPGDSAYWRLQYVDGAGIREVIAEGVQETVPSSASDSVLARYDLSHLQGTITFELLYGNPNGTLFRIDKVVHVGNRVNPGDSAYVQAMYGNAGVQFGEGAWGPDPVDVTVRAVAPDEYLYDAFGNLDIVGPVVEVLPSHNFGDSFVQWPEVRVKLLRKEIEDRKLKVSELKIYKPDSSIRKIVPLDAQSAECFIEMPLPVLKDSSVSCDTSIAWSYVYLKAKTSSFSDFIVLDSATAASFEPVITPVLPDTLHCAESALDTVWAGTFNGKLEFASPCVGRGNYLLQLRTDNTVAAEHRGMLAGTTIVWEMRSDDIWLPADIYTSRIDVYGVDGSLEYLRGPMVRIDSLQPMLYDMDVALADGNSGSRVVTVSASLADSVSGVDRVVLDIRFGGRVVENRIVSFGGVPDTVLYEQFVISPALLYGCMGCRVNVDVRIEDMGHNYVETSWRSGQIYPFPSSLVLWYPMSEGGGNIVHEIVNGSQFNLGIGSVKTPWAYSGRLSFSDPGDRSQSSICLHVDSITPMSVEFDAIIGTLDGVVFIWYDDSSSLIIGIENRKFYVDAGSGAVELSHFVGSGASERYVFVFDSSFVSLYVDGNFIEKKILPGGFALRNNGWPALGYYRGGQVSAYFRMSDLRIYRSALTAEQVHDLYVGAPLPDEPDTSVVDTTPVSLAVRAVELDSVPGLVVDQSCALPGRSYLRQGSGTSGKAVWNVDAPRAGNYALYVFGRGYSSANSRVEVSVNGVDVGTYGLRPSGLWESVRMGDSLLFSLDSGMNRVRLRPRGGAEIAGIAAISGPSLPEAHLVDYGQSGWAAPEPSVEALIHYDNVYDLTWARPRIKLRNLTGQYIYGVRIRYYYSGEGPAVAATSWYPQGPMSVVHDAGDVYYAEYALAQPIPPHGYANGGDDIQIGLYRTPDYKPWKIQDDPSYEHGSTRGYVEAKGLVVLDSKGVMLNGWNCVDDGMPATTPASGIRALAAEESNEPWKNSTIAVYVENNGFDSISGFEARYYYRDASGTMEYPDWYYLGPDTASAIASKVAAGGNLYYVSLVYNNVVLKPGKRTAAVKFGLHARGWSESAYSASDDPSHHGIGTGQNLLEADSVVVLDRNGNLLWGKVPRPNFQNNVVVSDSGASRVTRVGDMVYVNIDQTGYYYLEVVDAFGTVKNRLFEGTWNVGEHMVQIPASAMKAGRYIVLRRGNTILNWQLLK
ncbi:LamG-like jellyroll fold domain-containing protein [uncultured Fibrobacter sp.]|uniref:LamG-like jellyroll fold domain-containing protein n=1 Tax=uncultured Fibrobacter sp. TaxID=261512 RepID=UPI0025D855FA|nr:LamG-like jellyroll fold domain-containing protein [uncultured Fibrobacter sp.]